MSEGEEIFFPRVTRAYFDSKSLKKDKDQGLKRKTDETRECSVLSTERGTFFAGAETPRQSSGWGSDTKERQYSNVQETVEEETAVNTANGKETGS